MVFKSLLTHPIKYHFKSIDQANLSLTIRLLIDKTTDNKIKLISRTYLLNNKSDLNSIDFIL